jgi:hypothetical protein
MALVDVTEIMEDTPLADWQLKEYAGKCKGKGFSKEDAEALYPGCGAYWDEA